MFDKFTDRSRRAMGLARTAAHALGHGSIGTEHILVGLVSEEGGVASAALRPLGVTREIVMWAAQELRPPDVVPPSAVGQIPFTPRAKRALEAALEESGRSGLNYVGTEHILLGLLREDCTAHRALFKCRAEPDRVRTAVLDLLGSRQRPVEGVRAPAPDLLAAWHVHFGSGGAPAVTDATGATRAARDAADLIERLIDGDEQERVTAGAEARALVAALRGEPVCGACGGSKLVERWGVAKGELEHHPVPCPDCAHSRPPYAIFRYRNHRGAVSVRRALPGAVYWGRTEWHPEEQWLFRAWDLDKGAARDFALRDVLAWDVERCRTCDGRGELLRSPAGEEPVPERCPTCSGTGWVGHGGQAKDARP